MTVTAPCGICFKDIKIRQHGDYWKSKSKHIKDISITRCSHPVHEVCFSTVLKNICPTCMVSPWVKTNVMTITKQEAKLRELNIPVILLLAFITLISLTAFSFFPKLN